jgi:hypothetical protein
LAKGVELETISRSKFKANFDGGGGVIVVVPSSSNLPRDVNKSDFRNVYEKMRELRRKYEDVFRPALYQRITRNSSYILPIIRAVQTEGGKQKTLQKTKTAT